jgi:hypothetical protein
MKKVDKEVEADEWTYEMLTEFFDSIHYDRPLDWRNADTEPPDDDAPPRKSRSKPTQASKPKKTP